jgi:carboxylate-amine ligase
VAVPFPRQSAGAVPTFGVEEEFFLLDRYGAAAAVAPALLSSLAGDPRVQAEWMQFQVESATSVHLELPALRAELAGMRGRLASAAGALGALLVAVGTPPFGVPGAAALTERARYRRMIDEFSWITGGEVTCACHVHVGVPTRDVGVLVLDRIRSWLPVLLALGANSPFWRGQDSRWDSYRHRVLRVWPTATLPPRCPDAAGYDEALAARLVRGDALDPASVYWFARLSPRYPTVEIRVPDIGLTVQDAVLLAGLCRALVATALAETEAGCPAVHPPERRVTAALASAARYGLHGVLSDPRTGRPVSGPALCTRLLDHLRPALDLTGDLGSVSALLAERVRRGSGAARQRALRRGRSREAFVAELARETLAGVPAGAAAEIHS